MKKEELLEIGLTEEQATKVMDKYKESISGNYIPKATFDAEREKNKEMQKLLEQTKADASTVEELKKELETVKEGSKKLEEEYAQKELHRNHLDIIKKSLPDDIIDVDDIISRLDIESYTYTGDTVKGLSEDIDTLRKSKPHYFKTKETPGNENNNILGIIGLQKPGISTGNEGEANKVSADILLAQQLGKSQMQTYEQSQKSRETFF